MIVNAVTYVMRAGTEARAVEHFHVLETESRREAGCIGYVVHRSREDDRTFFLYELWADQAALDAHYELPHFIEHGVKGIRLLAESRVAFVGVPLFPQ